MVVYNMTQAFPVQSHHHKHGRGSTEIASTPQYERLARNTVSATTCDVNMGVACFSENYTMMLCHVPMKCKHDAGATLTTPEKGRPIRALHVLLPSSLTCVLNYRTYKTTTNI